MSKLIKECGKFTTIPDNITRDKDLDLKSRGLLLTLLSLPDDWIFTEKGLASLFSKEGRDSIHNTLIKLENLGYLKREQSHGVAGAFGGMDYIIYDRRQPKFTVAVFSGNGKAVDGLAVNGKTETI